MKSYIQDYDIEIELDENIQGLPSKIIITSEDIENPFRWIYTKTKTERIDDS